jgi:hypothetical protein
MLSHSDVICRPYLIPFGMTNRTTQGALHFPVLQIYRDEQWRIFDAFEDKFSRVRIKTSQNLEMRWTKKAGMSALLLAD